MLLQGHYPFEEHDDESSSSPFKVCEEPFSPATEESPGMIVKKTEKERESVLQNTKSLDELVETIIHGEENMKNLLD